MFKMSQVNYIRDLSNSGYRIAEISKKLKLDRKTVRKYLSQEDFSPTPPMKHLASSKLDPYTPKILEWLAEGQHVWRRASMSGRSSSTRPRGYLIGSARRNALTAPTARSSDTLSQSDTNSRRAQRRNLSGSRVQLRWILARRIST